MFCIYLKKYICVCISSNSLSQMDITNFKWHTNPPRFSIYTSKVWVYNILENDIYTVLYSKVFSFSGSNMIFWCLNSRSTSAEIWLILIIFKFCNTNLPKKLLKSKCQSILLVLFNSHVCVCVYKASILLTHNIFEFMI